MAYFFQAWAKVEGITASTGLPAVAVITTFQAMINIPMKYKRPPQKRTR
jgi:hypothetical protein